MLVAEEQQLGPPRPGRPALLRNARNGAMPVPGPTMIIENITIGRQPERRVRRDEDCDVPTASRSARNVSGRHRSGCRGCRAAAMVSAATRRRGRRADEMDRRCCNGRSSGRNSSSAMAGPFSSSSNTSRPCSTVERHLVVAVHAASKVAAGGTAGQLVGRSATASRSPPRASTPSSGRPSYHGPAGVHGRSADSAPTGAGSFSGTTPSASPAA